MNRRLLTSLAVGLILTMAACSTKEDNVKTMNVTDVTSTVNDYAGRTAKLIGDGLPLQSPATNTAPCEGKAGELSKDHYYVLGTYQVPLPVEQHRATLDRLRDMWKQQGYAVKSDRTLERGRGELTVVNPTDQYSITVTSTDPPTLLALLVNSPCFRSTG